MSNVLVVDDEKSVRDILGALLVRNGHEVETAKEGGEALRLLQRSHFDLVILDLLMPGMEGLETLMRIKKSHAGIKVIAISGGSRAINMDFLPTSLQLGADRALKKPFDSDMLVGTVNELLGN